MRRLSAAAFAWGAAEATVWFVIPDVLICYVALTDPHRAQRAYLAAVAGALAGSALLHTASRPWRDELHALFGGLPGIGASDIEEARRAVERRGPAAMIQVPLKGQPIKLYVYHAALLGIPLRRVMPFVFLNRVLRLGAFAALYGVAGRLLRRPIERWPRATAVVYVAGWSAGYSAYWARRSG